MQGASREILQASRVETLYRVLVLLVPLSLLGALAWLYASGRQELYLTILWRLGAASDIKFPFLDLYALLAAANCHPPGVSFFIVLIVALLSRMPPVEDLAWLLTKRPPLEAPAAPVERR
jgi:hypothetical protein